MFGLTIYEVQNYLNVESHAELIIDTSHRDDFVNINVDIEFPKVPCDILSLDVQDVLGTHKTDVMGELNKHRIDEHGKILSTVTVQETQEWRGAIKTRFIEGLKA